MFYVLIKPNSSILCISIIKGPLKKEEFGFFPCYTSYVDKDLLVLKKGRDLNFITLLSWIKEIEFDFIVTDYNRVIRMII